ncbi:MAG: hypothetical protein WAU91_07625 [Desulfatitalea sp.]
MNWIDFSPVFARSEAEIERALEAVEASGIPLKLLDETVDTVSGRLSVSTMHLANRSRPIATPEGMASLPAFSDPVPLNSKALTLHRAKGRR